MSPPVSALAALLLVAPLAACAGPGAGCAAANPRANLASAGVDVRSLRPETRARILREADLALARPPCPVETLASAGSTDRADARVVATRAGFEDADDAAILALAWKATGGVPYRDAAVARLLAWADTNVPTGNPIDETRLDGLVHAYRVMRPTLTPEEDTRVRGWLTTMRDAKRAWRFGPRTAFNNHRTHQLKMLLLLDRALDDEVAFAADRIAAERHAATNLDAATGSSVDLRERGALYYHVYNLDAWLEIGLLTGCCDAPITAAYQLLERRLRSGDLEGEFEGSTAPLDAARARAGYGYGGAGSTFEPVRAEHAILAFHTRARHRHHVPLPPELGAARIQRRNLYALARYESCAP